MDVVGALVLAVVFLGGVAFVVIRQATVGDDVTVIRSAVGTGAYKINLDHAPGGELVLLPGIGEKRAERIITWRAEHGPFKNYDQARKAAGMSKRQFEKLRAMVILDAESIPAE